MHCPYCNKTIKNTGLMCKHCDSDLRGYQRKVKADKAKRPFHMNWWIWGISLFLFLYIIHIFTLPSNINKPARPSTEQITPEDTFSKMSPAEHPEFVEPSRDPSLASPHRNALSDKSPEFSQAGTANQKISEAEKMEKSEKDGNDAIKSLAKEYDELEQIAWYHDKSTPRTNEINNISLYIGQKGGNIWLRYRISYSGYEWLHIRKYKLKVDGRTFDLTPPVTINDYGLSAWEWCDEPVNASEFDMFKKIANSNNAVIRYVGARNHKDHTITLREKNAIKNILLAYAAMGGKMK